MNKRSGFTLLEVLASLALTAAVLGAASVVFTSSNKLYNYQAKQADEEQALAAGLAQLSYELGLAGYRGTDLTVENISTRNFETKPTIQVRQGEYTDDIVVRYYEDKWLSDSSTTPQLKQVLFSVNDGTLRRREVSSSFNLFGEWDWYGGSSSRIVDGVASIKVVYWLNKYGTRIPLLSTNLDRTIARGLVIKLKYEDGSEELFTVAFQNQQQN